MNNLSRLGTYINGPSVGGEHYRAYIPPDLPPSPPIDLQSLYSSLDQANIALGRLDGMSSILPDPALFIYMYVRKEAVLSSQIEGTQSSLSDLLLYENEGTAGIPLNDVQEVSRYVAAMYYGLDRLKEFPLSLRLIREIHAKLMQNARGGHKQPGDFRTTQNWIGGTRPGNAVFVPPPPDYVMPCMDNFEKFLHRDSPDIPILVKAALIHVQFETIHPFLDGNGRLGRLLITFILCIAGVLRLPLLYISLYFKTHREEYYAHLQNVRQTGHWEPWIEFFLTGVCSTAEQATRTARHILDLFARDHEKITSTGKTTGAILSIHKHLQCTPVVTAKEITSSCKIALNTAIRGLEQLEGLGIVKEMTGRERGKIYAYVQYLDILNSES